MITIVGLGPGDPGLITQETLAAIDHHDIRFLGPHSTRPPTSCSSRELRFEVYDDAETFDDVYAEITDRLIAEDLRLADVLYAVPGSPLVLERTVQHLRAAGSRHRVLRRVSFLDIVWDDSGSIRSRHRVRSRRRSHVRRRCSRRRPDRSWLPTPTPTGCSPTSSWPWTLMTIRRAIILQGLGTPTEAIIEVAWSELDRTVTGRPPDLGLHTRDHRTGGRVR